MYKKALKKKLKKKLIIKNVLFLRNKNFVIFQEANYTDYHWVFFSKELMAQHFSKITPHKGL